MSSDHDAIAARGASRRSPASARRGLDSLPERAPGRGRRRSLRFRGSGGVRGLRAAGGGHVIPRLPAAGLALFLGAGSLAAAGPDRVRLIARDPWTFDVEVTSAEPFLGGELGLRFPSRELRFLKARLGPAFGGDGDPPGEIPGLRAVGAQVVPANGCLPDPEADQGLILYWIHPADPATGSVRVLPRGTYRILTLSFAPGAEAARECYTLRFAACLGAPGAEVANVLARADGTSAPLETAPLSACSTPCRILRFEAAERARCETLILDLRTPDGSRSLALREIPAAGLTGFDIAARVHAALSAVDGVSAGLADSRVTFCSEGGEPFRLRVDTTPPWREGPLELEAGETAGACGLSIEALVPDCPDGDRDGLCDGTDSCPEIPNEGDPCPEEGTCWRIRFGVLETLGCPALTFAFREPDGLTPVEAADAGGGLREVALPAGTPALDAARELCRLLASGPLPGFGVQPVRGGCQLCRHDGRGFLIFAGPRGSELVELEAESPVRDRICGLRLWLEPPDCGAPEVGTSDLDADGVCDGADNCPESFNPSQGDTDADCRGDACQGDLPPFEAEDFCSAEPARSLLPDREETWSLPFGPCARRACAAFDAPPGRPVLLELAGLPPGVRFCLSVGAGGAPEAGESRESCGRAASLRVMIPRASADRYFAVVEAMESLADTEVVLRARSVELELERVSPRLGAAGGRVRLVLEGGGFDATTDFALEPAAGGDPAGAEPGPAILSRERAEAVFDFRAVAVAREETLEYDLVAREVGVEEKRLPGAFLLVHPERARGLEVELFTQDRYRGGVLSGSRLRVRNAGTREVEAPLFRLSGIGAGGPTRLRLGREEAFGTGSLLVLATDAGGFAERLPPGAAVELPVLLQGLAGRDCLACPGSFRVSLFAPLPQDIVEWAAYAPPPGMDADGWREAARALPLVLGTTWVEVGENLGRLATRLTRRGVDASSVREVFRFAVRQALGRPSAAVAGTVLEEGTLRPVPAALVAAFAGEEQVSFAFTDARGTFAIDWLEEGRSYRLAVSGWTGGVETPEIPAGGDLFLVSEILVRPGGETLEPTCTGCDETGLPEEVPEPPDEVFTRFATRPVLFLSSWDPNEKNGDDGDGPQRLVGPGHVMDYTVYFENEGAAKAQRVVITDQLHPYLDWSRAELTYISVRGRLVPLGYAGPYRVTGYRSVLLGEAEAPSGTRASGFTLEASDFTQEPCAETGFTVTAGADRETGLLTWTFQSTDCAGEPLPPGSLEGFLAPGEGGFVSFSVPVRDRLADRSSFFNRALITFDDNPAIATNTVSNVFTYFYPPRAPENVWPPDCDPEDTSPPDCRATCRTVPLDVTLSWSRAEGAESYDVHFGRADEALTLVAEGLSGFSFDPPGPLEPETAYSWQVAARNIRGVETRGAVAQFCTAPPCPEAPVVELGERDCAGGVGLRWEPVAGADSYLVEVRRPGEARAGLRRATLEDRLEIPRFELPPGDYEATVAALNAVCPTLEAALEAAAARGAASLPVPFSTCGALFVRGDVDQSGTVNLTDGVQILLHLFRASGLRAPLRCLDAADTDDSGGLNLTDGVKVFEFLFRGGTIPLPSPVTAGETTAADPEDCGPDPTADGVDCEGPPAMCSAF